MFSFRILHISDLHLRGPREHETWRRSRVIDSFWQNLDELQSEGKIDLVCFTGDLADWGRPEEYEEAGLLLTELLSRLQLSKDQLFLIPGNHDVARTVELATWNRARVALRQPDASTVFSRWLAGGPAPYGLTADVLVASGSIVPRIWGGSVGVGTSLLRTTAGENQSCKPAKPTASILYIPLTSYVIPKQSLSMVAQNVKC